MMVKQMRTFRQACGDSIGLRLDLNYNFRTEGFCEIASALTPAALESSPIIGMIRYPTFISH